MSTELTIITFSMCGELYALPISSIRLLESIVDYTPIHGSPSHLKGLANLRGQIISIIELANIYNLDADLNEEKYLLVLKSIDQMLNIKDFEFNDAVQFSDDIIAISVGYIGGIITFPIEELDHNIQHLGSQRKSLVLGILKRPDALITIFNAAALMQYCQNTLTLNKKEQI